MFFAGYSHNVIIHQDTPNFQAKFNFSTKILHNFRNPVCRRKKKRRQAAEQHPERAQESARHKTQKSPRRADDGLGESHNQHAQRAVIQHAAEQLPDQQKHPHDAIAAGE